ncbi:Apc15p protein-domain-containing protein [Coniochaeta sp. 2T2.1]|nr:Apc15p protein-domain-containing protein [Coniochaeta sp. 2T2.1]
MMFDALPDLTPRDSHILWYTSLRNPQLNASHHDQPDINPSQPQAATNNGSNQQNRPGGRQPGMVPLERTPQGRLRADEAYMARRLTNISNFGATWLKPPGVPKSLYQMREERREAEEHAEAVRREQLAAELAEAEAAQAAQVAGEMGEMMDEGGDGEGNGMGEVDLDDEIPDADASGMGGFGQYEDSSEDEEEEDEDDVDRGENEDDEDGMAGPNAQQRRVQQRELASREDRLRELMARGGDDADGGDIYAIADEEPDDETQGEILEEEDLVHEHDQHLQYDVEPGEDLDMDANLDDDVPEAESLGGYEHTDSDAELSSSEDESGISQNVSFGAGGRGGRMLPPQGRATTGYRRSLASNATRQSLDISSILDSSTMGSSPQVRRRN